MIDFFRGGLVGWEEIWVKVFKNEPSEICQKQLLNVFTWSIFEYRDPYDVLRGNVNMNASR